MGEEAQRDLEQAWFDGLHIQAQIREEEMATKAAKKTKEQPVDESANVPAVVQPTNQLPVAREPVLVPDSVEVDKYRGVSMVQITPSQSSALMAPIEPTDVEIRPDGILYFPEIKYRKVLNTVIGAGQWALVPRTDLSMDNDVMYREYALFILGQFVSEARGQQQYQPTNRDMTYGDAAEGVKSNALMRCCKDLSIAAELWDPNFIEAWKNQYAIQVWRNRQKYPKPQWRRKDRSPFFDETGPVGGKSSNPASDAESTPSQGQQPKVKELTAAQLAFKNAIKAHAKLQGWTPEDGMEPNEIAAKCDNTVRACTSWGEEGKPGFHPATDDIASLSDKEALYALKIFNDKKVAAAKKAAAGKK